MPHADSVIRRAFMRSYQNAKRKEWRLWVLDHLGGKCAVCGSCVELEIHHRAPAEKSFFMSRIWSHSKTKQVAELKKCELRCPDHHKEVHAAKHGSAQKYKLGCRCDLCVSEHQKYKREYSARYRAEGRDKTRKNYKGPAEGGIRSLQD